MELVTLVQRQVLEILSLVNGIRHESKHHSPTGLITELTFNNTKISIGVACLKKLPWFVLLNFSVLTLCECSLSKSFTLPAQAIVMTVKLYIVDVSFNSNRHGEALPVIVFPKAT